MCKSKKLDWNLFTKTGCKTLSARAHHISLRLTFCFVHGRVVHPWQNYQISRSVSMWMIFLRPHDLFSSLLARLTLTKVVGRVYSHSWNSNFIASAFSSVIANMKDGANESKLPITFFFTVHYSMKTIFVTKNCTGKFQHSIRFEFWKKLKWRWMKNVWKVWWEKWV